ncbi:GNAT family N-acetyltransferase [Polymorphospora sp. NPDC050346]|uniref:GNAT family N-acetyltransferase n=1 Tax=Polymorphospora sp. NPDC050346 TaxID=3155780 RepID=UPI0034080B61
MAPVEPPTITEAGLTLRPWHPDDADAVLRACQDPAISRWTTVPSPYLPEHAVGFVAEHAPAGWAAGTRAPFAVCDAATGELLGSCGLVSLDRAGGQGEIGYWTAPWARGRGVAVRATRIVARWAFESVGLRRLVWRAEVGNHTSRLVALRAGFTMEGILRRDAPAGAGETDSWIGSLLPDDPGPAPGREPARPGSVEARRAAVFAGDQPTLTADAPGGRIRLRRPGPADVDRIVATCRDDAAIRWTSVPDPYHRRDAGHFLAAAEQQWARGAGAVFAIAGPAGTFDGSMALRLSAADPAVADVGFLISPAARNRGYASAALAVVCAWAFDALVVHRVEWRAHVGNTASRRVAEKAGFTVEGVARGGLAHRGARVDVWVGALLVDDRST